MILIFLSFQSIQTAYTDTLDLQQHILISQKSPQVLQVIKDGIKLRTFLDRIALIKDNIMAEQQNTVSLQSPVFICHSSKSKKITQPILQLISPAFERHVLYIKNDKVLFSQFTFTRALLIDSQICYGQGYSQLRAKQQLRLATYSIFTRQPKIVSIFIERSDNQVKELKKEGFTHIVNEFDSPFFEQQYKKAQGQINSPQAQINHQLLAKYPFAQHYLRSLIKAHKDTTIKQITQYNTNKIGINGFVNSLYRQSNYYNMSPKSWAPHTKSKEISSYVFHNASNNQLYLAKASRLRQLSNEQDYEKNILAYYVSFIINPKSYALPHDKISSLMKFSKIKSYQNKKALFNVRPYIQGLANVSELTTHADIFDIFQKGCYREKKIVGMGSVLLTSLLLNENLNVKSLTQQLSFVGLVMDELVFLNRESMKQYEGQLHLCRIDLHNVLQLSNYKEISDEFVVCNKERPIKLKLQQLHPAIINEIAQLAFQISQQQLHIIKSLVIYYRWNTKLVAYFDLIHYRLKVIIQTLSQIVPYTPNLQSSLLVNYPTLSCLLLEENYNYFMVPSKNTFSNTEYSYDMIGQPQKQPQNPYFSYINKTCTFAIYNICFPVHSFLQWVKSTNKYQIIEYMSMINHTLEDYVVMDKRLKLLITNEKKNAILVVDHVQLCQSIINRPKSIKTVMILRLKKANQIEDVGVISSEPQTYKSLREGEDQIINVLMRQGLKQFKPQDQFYLYDWVFKSYIKIKCDLYDLNYNNALHFSQILHNAICTNRHRLKEIKQNHPNLHVYLYTLPIIKDNQKIVYNYKLFEYLHVYHLLEKIIKREWRCKLQTYQNSSVLYWKHIIGPQLIQKIVDIIIEYLIQLQKQIPSQEIKERQADCLQLIRSLTQSSHTSYFKVFSEHINVQNYTKIQTILQNQLYMAVEDTNSFCISAFSHNQHITLNKCPSQQIICFSISQNLLMFVVKVSNQIGLKVQPIRIVYETALNYILQECSHINNLVIEDLINSHPIATHFTTNSHYLFFILQFKDKLILARLSTHNNQDFLIKQYCFQQEIRKIFIINQKQSYIICATSYALFTISITEPLQDIPLLLKQLHFFVAQKTSIVKGQRKGFDTQLTFFQNHQLQIISIKQRTVAQTQSIQLPQAVKALTIQQDILFLFYVGCDSLYVYKLCHNHFQRMHRYYWVDCNTTQLYVCGDIVLVRGGSYLKKVKLSSIDSKKDQMEV